MKRTYHAVRALAIGLLVCVALAGCSDEENVTSPIDTISASQRDGGMSFHDAPSFLTWNTYLGADINPVIAAPSPGAAFVAAAQAWDEIQASRIPDRARAIAQRIADENPHLVGLQEVFQFAELDATFTPTGFVVDMLASIEAELAAMGLGYTTVATQVNTASALPVAADQSGAITTYIAFQDRIAVLARNDVTVDAVDQGGYAADFFVNANLTLKRGWIRVDTELNGTPYHFVNTHLEGQSLAPIQALQADELMGSILAGLDGVTVLVGDLNSDAEGAFPDPSWTPTYGELISEGFVDLWELSPERNRPGLTCCHDKLLRNAQPTFDQRLDVILVRSDGAIDLRGPQSVKAEILGHMPWERVGSTDPVWPSDHAGLSARMRNGPGR